MRLKIKINRNQKKRVLPTLNKKRLFAVRLEVQLSKLHLWWVQVQLGKISDFTENRGGKHNRKLRTNDLEFPGG